MADRYWVGGTGTWDSSSTTNWAASSGGSSGASVPTASDNVFFDVNSNTGTSPFTVTMANTPRVCNDFTASGLDGTMTLAGSSVGLTVSGSLFFPASNFTRTYSGVTTFNATTTGKTINFNGITLSNNATFDGLGGGWTLASSLTTSSLIILYKGSLNTAGYSVSCQAFRSDDVGTRALTLGATTWTVTSTFSGDLAWYVVDSGGYMTVSRGTSTISLTGSVRQDFYGAGKTWGTINLGGSGGVHLLENAGTYANVTNSITPAYISFPSGYTNYFENFSVSGTSGNLVSIYSDFPPAVSTLSKVGGGVISLNYLSVTNLTATGSGATWYAGANSTNGGNNTGWIFGSPSGGMLFFFN